MRLLRHRENMKHSPLQTRNNLQRRSPPGRRSRFIDHVANIAQLPIDVHGLQSHRRPDRSAAPASIGAGAVPILQCQRSDRMHAGHSGDIARGRIETKNGPPLCNGSIAAPCHEPQAPGRIEIKLEAAKIGRQADAQSFDRRLLVCPQRTRMRRAAPFPAKRPRPCFPPG